MLPLNRNNIMKQLLFFITISIFSISTYAQDVKLDGYVYESGNRGYLNAVKVKVKDAQSKQVITTTYSDKEGHFSVSLPVGDFILGIEKDLFHPIEKTLTIDGTAPKVFEKIQMERKPGYLLDATIAEKRTNNTKQVDAITNSLIEVFNNTKDELVLILENHAYPTFKTTFERGNHYTILIRKDGFIPKRLEAFVDIKGCILCFDGVGSIQPGISDVLTESNQMGTFLANIELERLTNKNQSTTIYGTESLVEIIFMENLNSEILEVALDGQIKTGTTAGRRPSKKSSSTVVRSTPPKTNTSVTQTTSTPPTSVPTTSPPTKRTAEKTTITGVVSASTASGSTTTNSTAKIVTTQEINKSKPPIVTTSKPSSSPKNNTESIGTVSQATTSEIVPDYKRTSSSTNTILSRGNQGETLVKSANTKVNKPKAASTKERVTTTKKTSINPQRESLVQSAKTKNTAEFIAANYTGYLIEILLSTKEIAADNPIFKQHGQVKKELRSDGGYSYLLGGFDKKKEASTFLKEVVISRYPMAKVVYYVNGKFVGYVYIPRSASNDNPQPR